MRALLITAALLSSANVSAQLVVLRGPGNSIKTALSPSITLNEKSSMRREWVTINDPRMPVQLNGPQGFYTTYEAERYSGSYRYGASLNADATEAISAYEIRYVVFDVFGEHLRTLSATQVLDVAAGKVPSEGFKWNLFSETEAATAFSSYVYVAAARTADGRVVRADLSAVLAEIKKINATISVEDLGREKPIPKP